MADEVDLWEKLKVLLVVKAPDLDEVKDTISKIADKGRRTSSWSPVIDAIRNNQESVLDLLLQSGFLVNVILTDYRGIYDWCAVGAAIETNNLKLAKHLVEVNNASANLVRSDRETLLTAAITRSDWAIVELLLDELKACPNVAVNLDSLGSRVSPIHLAIWSDFYKGRTDWKMTKLLLKSRASMGCLSDWEVINGKILLGVEREERSNRNPIAFAEALKEVNQGRMEDKNLDALVELLKEQITIQDCNTRIEDIKPINMSGLANLNTAKTFFLSPFVTAAKYGRYDLVELMVHTLGFDVDTAEESTGLNPLAAAVTSGNKNMVRYLVKETGAKVDTLLDLELVKGLRFKCTSLAVAVNQGDSEMVSLLVEEFGADVNREMQVEGKPTSLLHHAVDRIQNQKSTKILDQLLNYGARVDKVAWARLGNGLSLVSPIEQALRLQARNSDDVIWNDVADKLTLILSAEETDMLKKLAPEDLVRHSLEERLLFEWHQTRMKNHLEVLAQKVGAANLNSDHIKDLRSKQDYMTEAEMAGKEKEFQQKIARSKAIEAEIQSILKSEGYLTEDQLEAKRAEPDPTKKKCCSCESKYPRSDLVQCNKKSAHIFCIRCTGQRSYCNWCHSNAASGYTRGDLEPMERPAQQVIFAAERLLERLKALRDSKNLLTSEEIEILTRKHEAEIERATILNSLVGSLKKIGDPDFSRQLEESYKALRGALGTSYAPKAKALAAEPVVTNPPRRDAEVHRSAPRTAEEKPEATTEVSSQTSARSDVRQEAESQVGTVQNRSSDGDQDSKVSGGPRPNGVVDPIQIVPYPLAPNPQEQPKETYSAAPVSGGSAFPLFNDPFHVQPSTQTTQNRGVAPVLASYGLLATIPEEHPRETYEVSRIGEPYVYPLLIPSRVQPSRQTTLKTEVPFGLLLPGLNKGHM